MTKIYEDTFDNGYDVGYRQGFYDSKTLGRERLLEAPLTIPQQEEKSTDSSTCEQVVTCARDRSPEERLEELGPRRTRTQTMREDSKPDLESPQSDYPPYYLQAIKRCLDRVQPCVEPEW